MSCHCHNAALLRQIARELVALAARPPEEATLRNRLEAIHARLENAEKTTDFAAELAEKRAEVLNRAYRGAMEPMRQAIMDSTSADDLRQRLATAFPQWNPARLTAELEDAMQLCASAGAGEV